MRILFWGFLVITKAPIFGFIRALGRGFRSSGRYGEIRGLGVSGFGFGIRGSGVSGFGFGALEDPGGFQRFLEALVWL